MLFVYVYMILTPETSSALLVPLFSSFKHSHLMCTRKNNISKCFFFTFSLIELILSYAICDFCTHINTLKYLFSIGTTLHIFICSLRLCWFVSDEISVQNQKEKLYAQMHLRKIFQTSKMNREKKKTTINRQQFSFFFFTWTIRHMSLLVLTLVIKLNRFICSFVMWTPIQMRACVCV